MGGGGAGKKSLLVLIRLTALMQNQDIKHYTKNKSHILENSLIFNMIDRRLKQ